MRIARADLRLRRSVASGVVIIVAFGLFGLGYLVRGGGGGATGHPPQDVSAREHGTWTCSMHPQIQLPKPGKCPICFMDLIPVERGVSDEGAPRRLVMSETARKLAEIETAALERRVATANIRMVGKVNYDETRLVHVTAWVAGRLDRLYVDYTGIQVRKGDHMVYMYSPELLAAQQELLEAVRAAERLQRSDQPHMKQTAQQTVKAARDKLRLWGLTTQQIQELETRGEPTDHVTVFAPTGGIVIQKHVTEGMYVDVGTRIYTIADLSRVWVLLDAYESDMSWIRYGQEVEFETAAYPGEIFRGRISFIDPVLDSKTRTVKVRVNVDNRDNRLKPEMFVRAVVHSHVAGGGRVMDPQLSKKWICPMHPEVVEDRGGSCRECGMELVTAESLGYVAVDGSEPDLMVPASAVLVTGKRAVVYVEVPDTEQPTYDGREIVIGPRAGDYYQVKSGLQEGERVVVHGAFKIDSALQIQARPSMMSPEGGPAPTGHEGHAPAGEPSGEKATSQPPTSASSKERGHAAYDAADASRPLLPADFVQSLRPVFSSYFSLQQDLARDDLGDATAAFGALQSSTGAVRAQALSEPQRADWMRLTRDLEEAAKQGGEAANLERARRAFSSVSTALLEVEEQFGHPGEATHYRVHCPMAFDHQGADWLQTNATVSNPYFGAKMARCGVVKDEISPYGTSTGVTP